MSDQDETFRVNVRFNRVEDPELDKDLSRYSGLNKGARIRMLMRLGLQVANGQIPSLSHAGDHPHLAAVVEIPRNQKKPAPSPATPAPIQAQPPITASPPVAPDPATKQPVVESIDALAGMGFDPTNFQFGAAAR
jgi:hypothetical protein